MSLMWKILELGVTPILNGSGDIVVIHKGQFLLFWWRCSSWFGMIVCLNFGYGGCWFSLSCCTKGCKDDFLRVFYVGVFGMIHGALLVALIYSVFSRLSLATKGILKLIKEFNFLEIPLACGVFIWCVGQSG